MMINIVININLNRIEYENIVERRKRKDSYAAPVHEWNQMEKAFLPLVYCS